MNQDLYLEWKANFDKQHPPPNSKSQTLEHGVSLTIAAIAAAVLFMIGRRGARNARTKNEVRAIVEENFDSFARARGMNLKDMTAHERRRAVNSITDEMYRRIQGRR